MKKGIMKVTTAVASIVLAALGLGSCNLLGGFGPQPNEYGTPNPEYIHQNDSIGENMTAPDTAVDDGEQSPR